MLEGLEGSKNDGDIGQDIDDNLIITKRPIKASNRKTHKQRRKERLSRIMVTMTLMYCTINGYRYNSVQVCQPLYISS